MKVKIKSFDVQMEVKNNGIEFDIFKPRGRGRLGDMILTKTHLIWCPGQTRRANGRKKTLKDLIAWMESDA